MTSTTIPITRKLEIVDKAIEILVSGGTEFVCRGKEFESGYSPRYRTHYSCHALEAAETFGSRFVTKSLKIGKTPIVRLFIKFSAQRFSMVPLADYSAIDIDRTAQDSYPEWWNSGHVYLVERVSHLKDFKEWLKKPYNAFNSI